MVTNIPKNAFDVCISFKLASTIKKHVISDCKIATIKLDCDRDNFNASKDQNMMASYLRIVVEKMQLLTHPKLRNKSK